MSEKIDQPRLRVTLRQLEVFAALARTGSTRAAADRVARSQSAASTALAALESALGAALFDRIGRRLVVNENGRALLPLTISLLDQAGELQTMFTREPLAPLRIAASFTIGEYLLPDLIARWKQAQPLATARLAIGNTSEVIDAVVGFEVDVGFIEGRQRHADLVVRRWLADELVVFAAPGHPLSGRTVGRAELAAAPWILREPGSGTREASERWLADRLGPLHLELELGSNEAVKRVVAAGLGVGCLSRHAVAEALAGGWLVEVRTRLPKAARALSIVVHRRRRVGRTAQAFIASCLSGTPWTPDGGSQRSLPRDRTDP
ncbi:MAG TPA: LysR family transcriptional regulator [Caldimonas sp.]|jgi:DNA-binding transcriptional LysR family regulator|nr:LysR family transcriptional regulator [Caldimonas sp.]HEX2542712.1 LysR family transcriptional regulator [Caldimonas sp.]